ncbi:unnamed protein product [Heligmosomoides polygyrus]|uniref:DDE_3 domain-containing protein n=1 Tax=Heligmosomoides polygyrus TaxID=6339 RepID=A0A183GG32_HELPZ|nr:unnamed protein product [Heligmosomoides polygyrus]
MKIVVAAEERFYHFFSAYASQSGCSDQAKDKFWSLLDEKAAEVPPKDVIIDLNGYNRERCIVTDAKIVPYETVVPQHQPLIYTLNIAAPRLRQVERCGAPRMKWW